LKNTKKVKSFSAENPMMPQLSEHYVQSLNIIDACLHLSSDFYERFPQMDLRARDKGNDESIEDWRDCQLREA
jgi:hypothetical protein